MSARETVAHILARGLARGIVNRVRRAPEAAGEAGWWKQRMLRSPWMIAPGNAYFALAGATFRMHARWSAWAAYEIAAFGALNGEGSARRTGSRSIWLRDLPGVSLDELARKGALNEVPMRDAGTELRRAHGTDVKDVRFSHGDLRLANVLYDHDASRAHLIDFETPHTATLPSLDRRADDLYAFLLDLVGAVHEASVANLARAFFEGYGDRDVLKSLVARLVVDTAILSRALQIVRSRFLSRDALERRMISVREALGP